VQGKKLFLPGIGEGAPKAVPLGVYRVGDGVIATIPGEPTKQAGLIANTIVLDALSETGVTHSAIGGLALDYIQYITTPAEYGAQSYEGASTLYGKFSASFLNERLDELARALAAGRPAPAPYAFDASYGVKPDGPAYGPGSPTGTLTAQPALRDGVVTLAWTGGANGTDRPVDRPFIAAERLVGTRWRTVDSDLGLDMIWRVDDAGHYTLEWRPATTIPRGTYRLHVTANRYELISDQFALA
jgi:neutral ceramidase